MKTNSRFLLAASLGLALVFTFSCSSNDEQISPTGETTNSTATKYCVYGEMRTCHSTSQLSCPAGGELSDFCPYDSPPVMPSSSSSSPVARSSSSSGGNPGVSSSSRGNVVTSSSVGNSSGGVVPGPSVSYGSETYQTVVIGTQTWVARNLNYDVPGNDTDVCYDNDPANCAQYGRLYDWVTAMKLPTSCNARICADLVQPKHQGICPNGWHIPSDADWNVLMTAVGGFETAGKYLKATNGWNSGGNGEDKFGFAALPGGYGYSGGYFHDVGYHGYWWSATEFDADDAYSRHMYYDGEDVSRYDNGKYYNLFSVRCLQD